MSKRAVDIMNECLNVISDDLESGGGKADVSVLNKRYVEVKGGGSE